MYIIYCRILCPAILVFSCISWSIMATNISEFPFPFFLNFSMFFVLADGWHEAFICSSLQRESGFYVVCCIRSCYRWMEIKLRHKTMMKTMFDALKIKLRPHTRTTTMFPSPRSDKGFSLLVISDRSLRSAGSEEGAAALWHRRQRGFDQRLDDRSNRRECCNRFLYFYL